MELRRWRGIVLALPAEPYMLHVYQNPETWEMEEAHCGSTVARLRQHQIVFAPVSQGPKAKQAKLFQ